MKICPNPNCKIKVSDAKAICPACGASLAGVAPIPREVAPQPPAAASRALQGVTSVTASSLQESVTALGAVLVYFSTQTGAPTDNLDSRVVDVARYFQARAAVVDCNLDIPSNHGLRAEQSIDPPELFLYRDGALLARRRKNDAASVLKWLERELEAGVPPRRTVAEVRAALEERRSMLHNGSIGLREVLEQVLLGASLRDDEWGQATAGTLRGLDQRLGWTTRELYEAAEVSYVWFQAGDAAAAQPVFAALGILAAWNEYFPFMSGATLQRLDRAQEAIVAYGESTRRKPTTSAHTNRGELLLQEGKFEDALMDLKASIELDTRGDDPFALRARALASATAEGLRALLDGKADSETAGSETAFTVVVKDQGAEPISVIKVVREVTGLGLQDAKDLLGGVPKAVKAGLSKTEAEQIATRLKDAGATVEIV